MQASSLLLRHGGQRLRSALGAAALLVLGFAPAGCRRSESSPPRENRQASVAAPARPALTVPYPPGRWRHAPQADIDRTLLWVSHLLIRHRDVPPGIISFHPPQWTPAPPAPERTREQAFELAERLATELAHDPTRFAALAARYSEDIVTKARGGRLGTLRPLVSASSPEVLDALATLAPGQVSRVVETQYGFHILRRHAPPRERRVSGARIVIGYDQAPWLARHLARRPIPQRSRSEAQALAQRIHGELLAKPEDFAQLVERYSEHRDALRQGDFGEWSTREQTPFPVAVDTLLDLEVGEVAPPQDSLFGFQIIQRTPERPRQRLAMMRAELSFDTGVPDGDPRSQAAVGARARHIGEVVHREPARISEFYPEVCCAGLRQWTEGQGNVYYEERLTELQLGESTLEPVHYGNRYAVLLRQVPEPRSPEVLLELPSPTPSPPALTQSAP